MSEHDYHALDLHLRRFWPDREFEDFQWAAGPIGQVLPRFRVRRLAPSNPDQGWTYVSIGAFEIHAGQRVEFVIESPVESPAHVESLAVIAHHHATTAHPLHLGRLINLGRPWLRESLAEGFMVNLPYPWGPELEWCGLANGERVQLLWLVPITPAEFRYAETEGTPALEDLFEAHAVHVTDAGRPSIR
ncbi:suppressor of fused domain protein [Nocardia huaxiensis]|uniref:suppressor of fused domain protein n=1 Tax=Nocardia huaxiensis TaxID=2755382 RepID=UPI001C683D53|nr:suppressor of fused domain protein [Nocardia huaxiensis]UFS98498.1 suppressor of fused domain protein [Nocardia huaxiensis]